MAKADKACVNGLRIGRFKRLDYTGGPHSTWKVETINSRASRDGASYNLAALCYVLKQLYAVGGVKLTILDTILFQSGLTFAN